MSTIDVVYIQPTSYYKAIFGRPKTQGLQRHDQIFDIVAEKLFRTSMGPNWKNQGILAQKST